jgi:two-component system phosphate regulon sensor histidine kinase PhoR
MIDLEDILLHDLKNSISGITGTLGLFTDGLLGPLSSEQNQFLALIDSSARELAGMLFEMQVTRNIEKENFKPESEPLELNNLLEKTAWLKQVAQREEKELKIESPENIVVNTDQKILTRVYENLLMNTIKHAEKGAVITVKIKSEQNKLIFEIEDLKSQPVPVEHFELVFGPEYKLDHTEYKSKIAPGNGFYFCKIALAALGGDVKLAAAGQSGHQFRFSIPI